MERRVLVETVLSAVDASDSTFQIRLVHPDEHLELRAVRLSAHAYGPHLAEHLVKESAAEASFWRQRAEKGALGETMATFIARESNGFVGVVDGFLSDDGRTVEIGGMWVSPSLRRSGIGRSLLAAVCAWASQRSTCTSGRGSSSPAARTSPERACDSSASFDVVAAGAFALPCASVRQCSLKPLGDSCASRWGAQGGKRLTPSGATAARPKIQIRAS